MFKTILTSIFTTIVVAGLMFALVGSNSPAVGGETRFPNSNITAVDITATDDLTVTDDTIFGSSAATTSVNFGKVCWTVTTAIGSTTYVTFNSTGVLATSTTNCN